VQQHQREKTHRLRFVGHQLRQHPGQPDRLGTQVVPHQVGAGRGRVTLVEQQIQHRQYGRRTFRQQVRRRHPVRNTGVPDLLLGPDQTLRHRLLADQERSGDLGGQQRVQAGLAAAPLRGSRTGAEDPTNLSMTCGDGCGRVGLGGDAGGGLFA
jgi:hypothetical protein